MRRFNTSGPNILKQHYTLPRENFIQEGLELVVENRYFTIWAPRQTGKSTYFRLLATQLTEMGYEIAHINFENYKSENKSSFLTRLGNELTQFWGINFEGLGIVEIFYKLEKTHNRKLILMLDEIEGINPEYFSCFLHSIRNAYHSRENHSLKSVILVGVTNIVGVVQDNASPFNIAENLNIDFFTKDELFQLFKMHEDETGQIFEEKVKEKIYEITAGQPGLVNGFGYQLVTRYKTEKIITYTHYLEVEEWYVTESIDKNVANIINKADEFRTFVEYLLFTEAQIPFSIDRPAIKALYTNGIVRKGEEGNVAFWVPLYKKRLYNAFYPYTNGEGKRIGLEVVSSDYFSAEGKLRLDVLIERFKAYVKRRGFGVFREKTGEKNEDGTPIYKSIPEAAMVYAFETYIQAILQELEGKSYREANVALGRTDLLINVQNEELLIETKVFTGASLFKKGKKQFAYYCKHLGLDRGIYLVFIPEHILTIHKATVFEVTENIEGVDIYTYLVDYEEEIPEYRKPQKKD